MPAAGLRRWTLRALTYAALLMALGEQQALGERFEAVRSTLDAWWPGRRRVGRTYQGFIKAWVRHSPRLLRAIEPHLRRCVRQTAGASWQRFGWVVMGVDGSKFALPRTAANERAFGCSGRGAGGPQAWLTTVLHLATGLPWCWKIGKANADERGHLRAMMHLLPPRTLLVADAGYTGYELWKALIDSGRSILIRVGSNVKLLTKLGYEVRAYDGLVYLWPAQQRQAGRPPLILRLIRLHDGRKEVCLVTDVMDPSSLSEAQAASIYRLRWGLELWFRAMKQTLDRRKMRSAAPVQAALELRWTVVGLSLLGLWTVKAILEGGGLRRAQSSRDPLNISPAAALRGVRTTLRHLSRRPPIGAGLWAVLRRAIKDLYVRHAPKAARHYPHKKTERPPGPPQVRDACPMEVQAAQQLRAKLQAA